MLPCADPSTYPVPLWLIGQSKAFSQIIFRKIEMTMLGVLRHVSSIFIHATLPKPLVLGTESAFLWRRKKKKSSPVHCMFCRSILLHSGSFCSVCPCLFFLTTVLNCKNVIEDKTVLFNMQTFISTYIKKKWCVKSDRECWEFLNWISRTSYFLNFNEFWTGVCLQLLDSWCSLVFPTHTDKTEWNTFGKHKGFPCQNTG